MTYAVYTNECILALGDSPTEAVAESGLLGPVAPLDVDQRYPDGAIVDLTNATRVMPDAETGRGDPKIRRCSPELAAAVREHGGDRVFSVARDGVLVLGNAED